jgi:hypothetical protein
MNRCGCKLDFRRQGLEKSTVWGKYGGNVVGKCGYDCQRAGPSASWTFWWPRSRDGRANGRYF